MSRMKRGLLEFIFFSLGIMCAANASAESTPIAESKNGTELRLNTGLLSGESHEYVYDADGSASGYKGYKISELIWQMDSVPMAGIGTTIPVGDMFRINMDYWKNAGEGDGTLDDYDWRYIGLPWSDWSHHENTIVRDVSQLDVNGDFDLYTFESQKTKLIGMLGYRQDHLDWQARGGYAIYSTVPTNYRDIYYKFANEAVGAYEQTFSTPYLGLALDTTNISRGMAITLHASVRYSMWVHGEDIDHHYLRDLVITQSGNDGKWLGADLKIDFELNHSWTAEVGYIYQKYSEIKTSKTYKKLTTGVKTYYPGDSGGLSHSSHTWNVGVKYFF